MNNLVRILLVDDSPYFLAAAEDFLLLQNRFAVTGTAREAPAALQKALDLQPDIILLDLNLGESSGLGLIPLFKRLVPAARVLVLTNMPDESYRAAAMQAGADGFIQKNEMSRTLISAIFELADNPASGPDGDR